MCIRDRCYALRGLEVVAAVNISSTIGNVFNVVFISLGNAVGIIIGQLLGAGKLEQARREDNQLIAFSVFCCAVTGWIMFLIAPLFPQIYNTDAGIQALASSFIRISGLCMPIFGFTNAALSLIHIYATAPSLCAAARGLSPPAGLRLFLFFCIIKHRAGKQNMQR